MVIRVENSLSKMVRDSHGEGFYAQLVTEELGGPSGHVSRRNGSGTGCSDWIAEEMDEVIVLD
ncbi:unnamed protein product [Caenorhabditis brenneri]